MESEISVRVLPDGKLEVSAPMTAHVRELVERQAREDGVTPGDQIVRMFVAHLWRYQREIPSQD